MHSNSPIGQWLDLCDRANMSPCFYRNIGWTDQQIFDRLTYWSPLFASTINVAEVTRRRKAYENA